MNLRQLNPAGVRSSRCNHPPDPAASVPHAVPLAVAQFNELHHVATADPMSCTLARVEAERRPIRRPGMPAPDNMIATGGMQPVVDYSQAQKRLLKTVEHRTWQAAETNAVLQYRYQQSDSEARLKVRRDERRLITTRP